MAHRSHGLSKMLTRPRRTSDDLNSFRALYINFCRNSPCFSWLRSQQDLDGMLSRSVARAGYRLLIAHSRVGARCELCKAVGARFLSMHHNRYGTGEEYRFWMLRRR